MKKAMMFPIHKKWVDKIFKGEKDYDFRNKLPKDLIKGMKIYLYETLGKMSQGILPVSITNPMPRYWCLYEGQGKVVGEATVGEIYVNTKSGAFYLMPKQKHILARMFKVNWSSNGFKNQKYAIELTNVIKYDEEWMLERRKLFPKNIHDISSNDWELGQLMTDASTSPIAKEEFVLWNKYQIIKDDKEKYLSEKPNLQSPPQAPVYVVEKEVK